MVLDRALGHRGRRRLAAIAVLWALCLCSTAAAELSQKGDLFVHFDGAISPRALPRHALAPIAVRIEGQIRAPSGRTPPSLREIDVELNRAGKLDTKGLALCRPNQIEAAAPAQALANCAPALIGSGGIVARTALPNQPSSIVRAEVLLFNAKKDGRPAILAHVYQSQPTPTARLVVFEIKRRGGTFGTLITGELPPSLNRNGYLTSIFLQLERRYSFHGKERSYLSAACSAPEGFSAAVFPFARASMSFDDGRTLSSVLTRGCAVRG